MSADDPWVVDLAELCADDVSRVGGKNASLGEMIQRLEPAGAHSGLPCHPAFERHSPTGSPRC